ncbi:DUF2199 domain-containing protein [Dactylosporangium matsuzakiense]|uniref:DUF2199 domain-containing protein n=1 Tax=Dactylosporangium matsuzakiense TaxID=53360 RepID=UPI0021C4660E|nr:DUF2199 domain-containing protein [Dactylosporangium matsuzakiense]UWZ44701.1 DUF2199 domain-containing protein [Dactylosporangium matsuzakiense]
MSADCPSCGRPLDAHKRHVRFTLPDPVLGTAQQERTPGTWMSHASARASVMMQIPAVGAFVRALLPVRLTDGYTVTFGVWLAIDPAQLQEAFSIWWEPEYQNLRMAGWLANAVQPWGLLATPVQTVVRDPDETPYCDSSSNPQLNRVLHEEWPHDLVLAAVDRSD